MYGMLSIHESVVPLSLGLGHCGERLLFVTVSIVAVVNAGELMCLGCM